MEYTLDELVDTVAARLAGAGIDRQDNGQVSAFPDRRTLRYYTTIGLMDRPDTVRNRQAIYGERHVTQAVAVKRLQASGMPLAAIQARLAGLPSAAVEAIASGRAEGVVAGGEVPGSRRGFWALPAAATTVFATGGPPPPGAVADAQPRAALGGLGAGSSGAMAGTGSPVTAAAAPAAAGARSHPANRRMAAPAGPAAPPPAPAPEAAPAGPAAPAPAPAPPPDAASDLRPMVAVPLTAYTTLLLTTERSLSAHDVSAIRTAAAALLSHLAAAGLTGAPQQRRETR